MSTDESGPSEEWLQEAEYEVKDRRGGKVQLEIFVPGERRPVGHGIKVTDIKKHPGTAEEAIEDRVRRIAARHYDPGDDLDLPEKGSAEYDPRTDDGRPMNEKVEAMRSDDSSGSQ